MNQKNNMRKNPETIDEATWFYGDAKGLDAIHEFYENGKFKKNARFHISREFISDLSTQADTPEELEILIKYIAPILRVEYATLQKIASANI